MLDIVSSVTYNPLTSGLSMPKAIALLLARAAQLPWWPMISPDEVERRYISDRSAQDVPGDWEKLGVEPEPLELHAIKFLRRYRSVCVTSLFFFCGLDFYAHHDSAKISIDQSFFLSQAAKRRHDEYHKLYLFCEKFLIVK